MLEEVNWFFNLFRSKKKIKRNISIDEISNLLFSQIEITHRQYETCQRDYAALKASDYQLIIYPEKILSSIFIELGIAIEKKKGITILTKNEDDLPFSAKELDSVGELNVNIIKYTSDEELLRRIEEEHTEIFEIKM